MEGYMKSFVDEVIKLAGGVELAARGAVPLLRRHAGKLALLGAGGLGVLGAQRGIQDIRMAEQMRKQMG